MVEFSQEEVIIIALILDKEEEENKSKISITNKQKRIVWVHDLWKKRKTEGEFTLYNGLIDDEQKFYEYFRMSQYTFNVLHKKLENLITKQETHWRKPIPPKERLAVCLR
ncbi:unnamed protein product [Macrosiphum euphorbiae]|uniref:Uncharacterized protein n=1 Tax=Macrosiphum euphorbiae TaxID=13131 RepID=A0AAV0W7B9_9HEMI|nr:unnamed protein product [Macrosiphum euphorbiae]